MNIGWTIVGAVIAAIVIFALCAVAIGDDTMDFTGTDYEE